MKTAMIYCFPSILEIALNSLLVSTQSYKREAYSLLEVLATNKFCLKFTDNYVGYGSIRAMIEMGIVYELVLPNRRKEYTILILYDEQATSNTLSQSKRHRVISRH